MQASTVGTPTASRYGTIFITIELSQKSWLVTLHSPDQDKLSRHQLAGGDHAGLVALIDRIRDRAARALGGVPAVASCYEAGYDGFWLHRLLLAAGITNYVFRSRQHCRGPAGAAGEDRPDRRRDDAADADGVSARRAAGGADRAGTFCRTGGCPPRQPRTRPAGEGANRAHQPDQGAAAAVGHGDREPAAARLAELAGNAAGLARPGGPAADAGRDQTRARAADAGARAARCARQDTGPSGSNPCGGADDRAQRAAAPPQM